MEPAGWYSVNLVKDQQKRVYRIKQNELTRVYDSGGSSNWKITMPQNLLISGVVFDKQSCFIAGTFTGVCQIGASSYTANSADGWIARFALDRTLVWFNTFTGPNDQSCGEICLMGNDIAVTGGALDTIKYLGAAAQNSFWPNNPFMFLSKISQDGQLVNLIAANVDTIQGNMYAPASGVYECASDELGNLYIFGVFEGKTSIGGYKFKQELWEANYVVMKFDNSFNVKYCTTIMGDCEFNCDNFRELHVNTKSEAMLLESYSYFQSGNDTEGSSLLVLSDNGKLDTAIGVTRDAKGCISDMDLDSCDNIYLTGYGRNDAYSQPEFYFMTTYQMSPEYSVTWRKNDTVFSQGARILSLSYNECFTFANEVNNSGGKFGILQTPFTLRCKNITSLVEQNSLIAIKVFPNPFQESFKFEGEIQGAWSIHNSLGQTIRELIVDSDSQEIDISEYPPGLYFLRGKNTCVKLFKL